MIATYTIGLLVIGVPVAAVLAYEAVKRRQGYPPPGSRWKASDGDILIVLDVKGRTVRYARQQGILTTVCEVDIDQWLDTVHRRY